MAAALKTANDVRKTQKRTTDSKIQGIWELCQRGAHASCVARARHGTKTDLSGGTCRVDTLDAIREHLKRIQAANQTLTRELKCARAGRAAMKTEISRMQAEEKTNHAKEARTIKSHAAALRQIKAVAADLQSKVASYDGAMVKMDAWSQKMAAWEENILSGILASDSLASCA